MPRGQPDFGAYQQKTVGATLADMGELAARLGSIDTYDRRGDVVFLDDFESPVLKWEKVALGATTIKLDTTIARSGSQSIKFNTPATLALGCYVERSIFHLGSRRLGGELHFCRIPTTASLYLDMFYHDGTFRHEARCVVDFPNATLEIQGSDGLQKNIATELTFPDNDFCFVPLKMVVDFTTDKYVRLMLGSDEYDISTYSLKDDGVSLSKRDYVKVALTNDDTNNASEIWVDDFIFTQNEP